MHRFSEKSSRREMKGVEVPGNRDFPVISSPRIQPTDHMSTALEYLVDPNKI